MTLLRLIQGASILAGMTFAGLAVYSNPAHADTPQFCVIANNGKTVCGTLKAVERACVTTNGSNTVCGKFKSAQGEQKQQETRNSIPMVGFQKEIAKFVVTIESCKRVDESVRCQFNILNKGKERRVLLSATGSSLVDSTGKSHGGTSADSGSGSSYNSTETTIASNNEIIISIVFSKIPDSAVKAQLLNLAFIGELKPIQFRNVPILN